MQLLRNSPERDSIERQIPSLASLMKMRMDCVLPGYSLSAEELATVVLGSIDTDDPFELWVAGPCLVGLSVVKPWHTQETVLAEEFIVRYKKGDFSDTIKELEQHASEIGCSSLAIGSFAMIRKISYGEFLRRKGFVEISQEYIKAIA